MVDDPTMTMIRQQSASGQPGTAVGCEAAARPTHRAGPGPLRGSARPTNGPSINGQIGPKYKGNKLEL